MMNSKFTSWENQNCEMPDTEAREQASGEGIAIWKAKVLRELVGAVKFMDITCGMGIDSWALSQVFPEGWAAEESPSLFSITQKNFTQLGIYNIDLKLGDGVSLAKSSGAGVLYADPDRRKKGERLKDPQKFSPPLKDLLQLSDTLQIPLLIKYSPMMDAEEGKRIIPGLEEIWFCSEGGEMKEINFFRRPTPLKKISIRMYAHTSRGEYIHSGYPNIPYLLNPPVTWNPGQSLWIPDPAVRLSGLWPENCQISPNRNLAVLFDDQETMAGTLWSYLDHCPFKQGKLSDWLSAKGITSQLNVSAKFTRIHTPDLLKKWKLKPGGDYLLWIGLLFPQNTELSAVLLIKKS
jgi:hypothetical protein